MSEFLFLYRGAEPSRTPAEMQQQMQRWGSWMKNLSEKGHIKNPGHPLERAGKVVRKGNVTDGPFAEKDVVGGYTLVEAKDLAHAVELSAGCPIHEYGGMVEVRPIMQMNL